jgi:hypothetical protein
MVPLEVCATPSLVAKTIAKRTIAKNMLRALCPTGIDIALWIIPLTLCAPPQKLSSSFK